MQTPQPGRIVTYRGKIGLHADRPAIVVTSQANLVLPSAEHDNYYAADAARVLELNSPQHLHLWVFTPSEQGGFAEFNVAPGDGPGQWRWPDTADLRSIGRDEAVARAAAALETATGLADVARGQLLLGVADRWIQLADVLCRRTARCAR
jgi:hypothetical protein